MRFVWLLGIAWQQVVPRMNQLEALKSRFDDELTKYKQLEKGEQLRFESGGVEE